MALRTMKLTVSASGRTVHEGWLTPGTVKVHLPGQALEATFLGPYDVLHLHMPSELLARCMATGHDEERGTWVEITDSPMASDPVVDRLVRSLIRSDGLGDVLDQLHAESIALAIVARVISNFARRAMPATAPAGAGLAKWRLRRSLDFIETHLAASIGLADMAASAGISRMHFAAQFRAAMGIRPHDYLLRRRIERAQDMLSTSRLPLAEVALEVGFKSQSHFTTVFTKLVGETPRNWRQRTRADAAATGTGSAISRMA
ncbi:MAG: AraC family transcriptional regulator [Acetobacteraceae bacterium]